MPEPGSAPLEGNPPSIDRLARHLAESIDLPHPLLVDVARAAISGSEPASVIDRAFELAQEAERRLLQPVVNATGVLLHTNLGRAPLAVEQPAAYSNLELDLRTGRRGDRSGHAARLAAKACGAEDALVVNNGAAALMLVASTVSRDATVPDPTVVVSRGELIEIGGGFRIPEVLAASGAQLIEVGTTNRTTLADYANAVDSATAALLKVHTSNYRIVGFTHSVDIAELARLAKDLAAIHGWKPRVVADLGSGLLDANCPWLRGGPPKWLAGEPAARQVLAAGADLVTFSCDKLMGGPQAGIVAGSAALVDACRKNPLARVFRAGDLVLSALQKVLLSYLRGDVAETVPLWRMATTEVSELRSRATALGVGDVVDCGSVMGGGSVPGQEIPSVGIALDGDVRTKLLHHHPPVLARTTLGRTMCDLRSVLPEQDADLRKALLS